MNQGVIVSVFLHLATVIGSDGCPMGTKNTQYLFSVSDVANCSFPGNDPSHGGITKAAALSSPAYPCIAGQSGYASRAAGVR